MALGLFLPNNFPAMPPPFWSFDFELFFSRVVTVVVVVLLVALCAIEPCEVGSMPPRGDSLPFLPVGGVGAEVRLPFGEGGGIDNCFN